MDEIAATPNFPASGRRNGNAPWVILENPTLANDAVELCGDRAVLAAISYHSEYLLPRSQQLQQTLKLKEA
jgi:hypothetical protein